MPMFGNSWGDMELVELNEGLGRYFGTDSGLLVVSAPKSDSFKLQDGDVIMSIDDREPTSVSHAMRILASYQPGESLELNIMRDKRRQTLNIELPDDRTSFIAPPAPVRPAVVIRQSVAPRPEERT
jgi:S1-C subfamily serine protease